MTEYQQIADRFARETAEHQMTVMHDDGLYRHLHFQTSKHSMYWFDLITVPGTLIFQGDGDSYVFRRLRDMFEFFRGSAWKGTPNVGYWAEKLTSDRNSVMRYDEQLLAQHVREAIADYADELPTLADAVQLEVLDALTGDESIDRQLVDDFRHYASPRYPPDFEFTDTWEWNCRDYDWWFLWACHAIVWGIAQYDQAHEPVTFEADDPQPVMDAHLPGDAA